MPSSNPATASVVNILMAMYELTEQYRMENYALQELLRVSGLTRRQLRKEMSELLKNPKGHRSADRQFRELVGRMKVFFEQNPVNQELLAAIPVTGKPQ